MKYIKRINEFRQQLEIPFDGKDPLFDKPTHIHVLDAIEDLKLNKNVKEYNSNKDIYALYDQYYNDGYEEFKYYWNVPDVPDSVYNFFYDYPPKTNPSFYDDQYQNQENIDSFLDMNQPIDQYLSSKGLKFIQDEYTKKMFLNELEETDLLNNIELENNLVRIYRSIDINRVRTTDEYQSIIDREGLGIYWSYDFDGAISHGGGYGETFIFCALVKPEYINWVQTLYKASYSLKYEKEIELLENTTVILDGIKKKKENVWLDFEESIIPV